MNKRLLTLLVLGLTTATTACAITPAMQKSMNVQVVHK